MFTVDAKTGWIAQAHRLSSPNFDSRPANCGPELIVVHGISLPPGEFGGPWIDRLFTNTLPVDVHPYFREIEGLRVSSHALIRRDGQLTQYVSLLDRAWHAGESEFAGRPACNDFSIGIELEGTDDLPYTSAQYRALAQIVTAIRDTFPACRQAPVVGHADIAPGRKTDPGGAFDWDELGRRLAKLD